jgi:DNA repair exonuclease SbcCD ATPase subunit
VSDRQGEEEDRVKYIARIEIVNFKCFPEVVLDLQPTVYAIAARHANDPGRSNWSGKSALVGAIRFALYGSHDAEMDDQWITDGAKEGVVKLTFDDGSRIARSRKRGRSTQLEYYAAASAPVAKQNEAQILIDRAMGIGEIDFLATCFFEQKQMSRFITATPADRLEAIRSWFQLEKLETCEANARDGATAILTTIGIVQQHMANSVNLIRMHLGADLTLADLESRVPQLQQSIVACKAELPKLQEEFEGIQHAARAQTLLDEGSAIAEEGKLLVAARTATSEADLDRATRELDSASGLKAQAKRDHDAKRLLAKGAFDGRCPIAEIECPVRAKINADRENGRALEKAAQEIAGKAIAAYEIKRCEYERVNAKYRAGLQREARITALRERVASIKKQRAIEIALSHQGHIDEAREKILKMQNVLADTSAALISLQRSITFVVSAQTDVSKFEVQLIDLQKKLDLAREVIVVFGKQGAQRRVAEVALARIEEGANEMLRACAIELRVDLRWSREGSGLAKTCDACGAPFPATRTVKECERCHTARGPNLVNKLEVVRSNKSGAADDLAGAAIQLTASAWLRAARDAEWSVAVLDEPLGALDETNRRSFGAHLATMLRGHHGFAQAFVIAHSPDTLNSLPGRIEIVSSGEGPDARSTARVIA